MENLRSLPVREGGKHCPDNVNPIWASQRPESGWASWITQRSLFFLLPNSFSFSSSYRNYSEIEQYSGIIGSG
jgi:hypothetical protein